MSRIEKAVELLETEVKSIELIELEDDILLDDNIISQLDTIKECISKLKELDE